MSSDPDLRSCEEFQRNVPELLLADRDLHRHPHVMICPLCRALIDDLERIAREAGRRHERSD